MVNSACHEKISWLSYLFFLTPIKWWAYSICYPQQERTLNMETAAIYARVSTDEQKKHGISLDAQVAKCEQYAKDMGYSVIFIGIEGLSGKNTDRPELQVVLEMVSKKRVNHVLTVKLDRLSRETEDAISIGKLLAKKNVGLHLVSEGGLVDLTDPAQEMMFTMRAAMGKFERRRIALNTKTALSHKRDLGERISRRAPFGFKFENNMVVENPDEQKIIARVFELRNQGFSERKISAQLATEGLFNREGNQFAPAAIHKLLAA
jgi:site-specific DNA recombinase